MAPSRRPGRRPGFRRADHLTKSPGGRMAEKIGFIGLGLMGQPMARNLMKAGYELIVYNIPADRAEELGGEGATVAANSREVAAQSDVIITMLPDSPDVAKVVSGENGVLEGIKAGAL